MKVKYTTVKIGGIIARIGKITDHPGYTESILECNLPDPDVLNQEEINQWIATNNKRMEAICQFLNENNL